MHHNHRAASWVRDGSCEIGSPGLRKWMHHTPGRQVHDRWATFGESTEVVGHGLAHQVYGASISGALAPQFQRFLTFHVAKENYGGYHGPFSRPT